jgi:hypothetical protein
MTTADLNASLDKCKVSGCYTFCCRPADFEHWAQMVKDEIDAGDFRGAIQNLAIMKYVEES